MINSFFLKKVSSFNNSFYGPENIVLLRNYFFNQGLFISNLQDMVLTLLYVLPIVFFSCAIFLYITSGFLHNFSIILFIVSAILAPFVLIIGVRILIRKKSQSSLKLVLQYILMLNNLGCSLSQTAIQMHDFLDKLGDSNVAYVIKELSYNLIRMSCREHAWNRFSESIEVEDLREIVKLICLGELYGSEYLNELNLIVDQIISRKNEKAYLDFELNISPRLILTFLCTVLPGIILIIFIPVINHVVHGPIGEILEGDPNSKYIISPEVKKTD